MMKDQVTLYADGQFVELKLGLPIRRFDTQRNIRALFKRLTKLGRHHE